MSRNSTEHLFHFLIPVTFVIAGVGSGRRQGCPTAAHYYRGGAGGALPVGRGVVWGRREGNSRGEIHRRGRGS